MATDLTIFFLSPEKSLYYVPICCSYQQHQKATQLLTERYCSICGLLTVLSHCLIKLIQLNADPLSQRAQARRFIVPRSTKGKQTPPFIHYTIQITYITIRSMHIPYSTPSTNHLNSYPASSCFPYILCVQQAHASLSRAFVNPNSGFKLPQWALSPLIRLSSLAKSCGLVMLD